MLVTNETWYICPLALAFVQKTWFWFRESVLSSFPPASSRWGKQKFWGLYSKEDRHSRLETQDTRSVRVVSGLLLSVLIGSSKSKSSALPGKSPISYMYCPYLHYSGHNISKWHYFTKNNSSLWWPLWGSFDLNNIVHWEAPRKRMEVRFLRAAGQCFSFFCRTFQIKLSLKQNI